DGVAVMVALRALTVAERSPDYATPPRPLVVAPSPWPCERRPRQSLSMLHTPAPSPPPANHPGTGDAMPNYSLIHIRDADLVRQLAALVNRDRATTAMLLAHIAEVDDRRLYRPAGY